MRSVGGGRDATCSGESASAVWSLVTVCSSYIYIYACIHTKRPRKKVHGEYQDTAKPYGAMGNICTCSM